jgi:hypothetical protein
VSTGSKPLLSLVVVVINWGYGVVGIDIKTLEPLVFASLLNFKTPTSVHPPSVRASKGLEADKAEEATFLPGSEEHC